MYNADAVAIATDRDGNWTYQTAKQVVVIGAIHADVLQLHSNNTSLTVN